MNQRLSIRKLLITAMLFAVGMILPFLIMYNPAIGKALSPMHFPAFLTGMICGPWYGLLLGLTLPLFRSMTMGMPPLPTAICMAIELAAYGMVSGFIYKLSRNQKASGVWMAMIPAMLVGRIMGGLVQAVIAGVSGGQYSLGIWAASYITSTMPSVIVQLILIPLIMTATVKAGLMDLDVAR